jgi:DNA topoisomerase I
MAATVQPKALVIVESPTKAKTIRKYLGPDYVVEASMGHVRDLASSASEIPAEHKKKPWARLAVDVDNGFKPIYVVPTEKKKVVAELKKALKGVEVLYLATDEDREGEAIGWHLLEVLKPKVPVHRLVFHEITEKAIKGALAKPRELDIGLVTAQETRRVLDRLVGYEVSPLLWRKIARGLSAGRVQSVAVRLLVMRERERSEFVKSDWWNLKARLATDVAGFDAVMTQYAGQSIASGRHFNEKTGALKPDSNVLRMEETDARSLLERLKASPFEVKRVEKKIQKRSPAPPFTTSTLQQEANRKLSLGSKQTMQVAQKLYEQGHITYMRTDSLHLSEDAVAGIRKMVVDRYSNESLSPEIRRYKTKNKGAQEAHEAIRPSGMGMLTASELKLSGIEARLYDLIWKRTVATQMANAQVSFTTATIEVQDPKTGESALFRASGREVVFAGFFRAYVEGSDDPLAALDDKDQPLPSLTQSQKVKCDALDASHHETKPPARYTEATLVKELEAQGIGRPSTYASIIDTIQRRGYVRAQQKQMVPTFTAMAVTRFLEASFAKVVDVEFTASMEGWLDEIATGQEAVKYLAPFYHNELGDAIQQGAELDARTLCTIENDKIAPFRIRIGKYGPFAEYEIEGRKKPMVLNLPDELAPADVDRTVLETLKQQREIADAPIGVDPDSGLSIYVKTGRYGPFVQLGEVTEEVPKPKRVSVPTTVPLETVDLKLALSILSLPRTLGAHPEDQEPIIASVGRYGPYVAHKRTFASLPKGESVLEVELARALVLIAEKQSKSKKAEPIRTVGVHPESGIDIEIFDGRYGPYIKYERLNVTLPKDMSTDEVGIELAVELIAKKAAQKGTKRKPRRKKS